MTRRHLMVQGQQHPEYRNGWVFADKMCELGVDYLFAPAPDEWSDEYANGFLERLAVERQIVTGKALPCHVCHVLVPIKSGSRITSINCGSRGCIPF